jgi:hypothetical protein
MPWPDYIAGQKLFIDGDEVSPRRDAWNFTGATATYNESTKMLDIAVEGGGGGTDLTREPILVAAVSNITLSGLAQVIQGVDVDTDGMRVGAFGQSDGTANGVYIAHAGAWTRATDFDSDEDCVAGMGGLIQQGTYNNGRWTLTTDGATLGVTTLDFVVDPHVDVTGQNGVALTVASGVPSLTKISDSHITDDTISITKLSNGSGNEGKFIGVNASNVLGWYNATTGVTTALGTALTPRTNMQVFGLEAADTGSLITLQRPLKEPRTRVRVIRTTNIADFDAITQAADGHTLLRGHTFWAAGQSTASQNGVYYVYRTLGSGLCQAIKLTGLSDLATTAEGGLHILVRGGNTFAGTIRRVTNFAAASVSAASVAQPFTGLDFGSVDIEDYATAAELATAEASQDWEPAFNRAQEALSDDEGGGEIRIGTRRVNYRSTSTWKIRRNITLRGVGAAWTYGAKVTFVACGGIETFYPQDLREYVRVLDTSGGTTSGLTVDGIALTDSQRVLRATTGRDTTTTASFVHPAIGLTVQVEVASSAGQTIGTNISILEPTGKYESFEVISIDDATHITVENLGLTATSIVPGATVAAGATVGGDASDGFWLVHSGAWTRPTDYDTSAECDPGCRTKIIAGTHAGEWWEQANSDPVTIGSTPLKFKEATESVDEFDARGGFSKLSGVALTMTGTPGDLDEAHGIMMNAPMVLENVLVDSFSAHGVFVSASVNRIPPTGANRVQFQNVRCTSNGLCGVRLDGPDANACVLNCVSCTSNGTRAVADEDWGIYDGSFLGNMVTGASSSSNGGSYKTDNPNARTVFIGCYSEADNQCDILPPSTVFNSRMALRTGATATFIPGVDGETAGIGLTSPKIRSSDPGSGVVLQLGLFTTDQVLSFNMDGSGDTSGYTLEYSTSGGDGTQDCWNYQHANSSSRRCFALTGPAHGRSYAQPFARLGLLLGGPAAGAFKLHAADATASLPGTSSTTTGGTNRWTGVYATGDWMFNSGRTAASGLPTAWRCTNTAGTLTWAPIYAENEATPDLTAQTASLGTQTLMTSPPAGLYEVTFFLECPTADGGASGTVLATLGFTNRVGASTRATATLSLTATGSAETTFKVRVASGNLTYTTTVGGTIGTATYNVTAVAKRIG